MAYLSPEEQESFRLQQKIWPVFEYVFDNAKAWFFGWIIIVGGLCVLAQDQELLFYLVGIPVFCLLGLAVLVAAVAFIYRVLRLFL